MNLVLRIWLLQCCKGNVFPVWIGLFHELDTQDITWPETTQAFKISANILKLYLNMSGKFWRRPTPLWFIDILTKWGTKLISLSDEF